MNTTHSESPSSSRKNLTDDQRQRIFQILLKQSDNGKLRKGALSNTASLLSTSTKTVSRIWRQAKIDIANGLTVNVSFKILGRSGRKRVEIDLNQASSIPARRRTNIRSFAKALGVPKSTLYMRVKEGNLRRNTNSIKPFLTEAAKRRRLQFSLSMIDQGTLHDTPTFIDMYDRIHIDEKWFYMSKICENIYLHRDEIEPLRTCKNKNYITKVMFMAAVARPRFDTIRNQMFDGKIGIFPFIYKEQAKRNSKNRAVGTLETKSITSVTKDVIRSCLIEKLLPAIRAKWPSNGPTTIFIQQDNARPHVEPNDAQFVEEAAKDGFDIRLTYQPPNSPDMNVLDLGYFRAIQSLQHQEAPLTIDELVNAVEKSFNELSQESLNKIFLTLQLCMVEVMKVNGGNNYKLPHIGKDRLEREGVLPSQIQCDVNVVNSALLHLQM